MVFVAVMLTAVDIDMRQHRHVEADRSDAVNLQHKLLSAQHCRQPTCKCSWQSVRGHVLFCLLARLEHYCQSQVLQHAG